MKFKDVEIKLKLDREFTSLKSRLESLVKEEKLNNANIICWVPHEVSSLTYPRKDGTPLFLENSGVTQILIFLFLTNLLYFTHEQRRSKEKNKQPASSFETKIQGKKVGNLRFCC